MGAASMDTALLEIRFLPWRPHKRVMNPDSLRDAATNGGPVANDLEGLVIGLVLWLFIIIAAPVIVLVLAAGLFTVELPLVVLLGVLLFIARFTGIIPWTVLVLNTATGEERRESFRVLWRATARVRDINLDKRVKVRWAWA